MHALNLRLTALVLISTLVASVPLAALCEVVCVRGNAHHGTHAPEAARAVEAATGAVAPPTHAHHHHDEGDGAQSTGAPAPSPAGVVHDGRAVNPRGPAGLATVDSSRREAALAVCHGCPGTLRNPSALADRLRTTGADIAEASVHTTAAATSGFERGSVGRYRPSTAPRPAAVAPVVLRI